MRRFSIVLAVSLLAWGGAYANVNGNVNGNVNDNGNVNGNGNDNGNDNGNGNFKTEVDVHVDVRVDVHVDVHVDVDVHIPTLTVVLTGDILLDRGVRQVIERHGADHLFSAGVDSVFRQAQVVVGNLECPATRIQSPVFKRFIFRAEPEWLATLRSHGITHLNLANNHSIDQGREGLMDTSRNIVEAGMVPLGAGANMNEAVQPVLLADHPRQVWLVPSLRLALENYAYLPDQPCVSQEPMDSLLERVNRIKRNDSTAVVIVSLHWGGEHTLRPVPRQRLEAHRLIDAGADVLVCHHTHTLQTIEQYRGRHVYYSVGNFIFDQHKPLNTQACMVRIVIKEDGFNVETVPIEIRQCVPFLLDSNSTAR